MFFTKTKKNPVQEEILHEEGSEQRSEQTKHHTVTTAYETIEVVNRTVNMTIDNAALITFDLDSSEGTLGFTPVHSIRPKKLNKLLNLRPNPEMDASTFKRLIITDFLLEGNAFIHYDGESLYHIPAANMKIIAGKTTRVSHYIYAGTERFDADDIIHVKDNSLSSKYIGRSRINSCIESLISRENMLVYKNNVFTSGTSIGLVIEVEDFLNAKLKNRLESAFQARFNAMKTGGGRPFIADGGAKVKQLASVDFSKLGFKQTIDDIEEKVAVAMGIPPLLLNSGNNANIRPNLELWFYTTLLPMMEKFVSAFEFTFGYDIAASTHKVPALQPDKEKQTKWVTAQRNNGVITGHEARKILRYPALDDKALDDIILPANVAGSQTGVSGQEGGAPRKEED
jgi:HK97 family phage portal protein